MFLGSLEKMLNLKNDIKTLLLLLIPGGLERYQSRHPVPNVGTQYPVHCPVMKPNQYPIPTLPEMMSSAFGH